MPQYTFIFSFSPDNSTLKHTHQNNRVYSAPSPTSTFTRRIMAKYKIIIIILLKNSAQIYLCFGLTQNIKTTAVPHDGVP
jgi:hypothetical protein